MRIIIYDIAARHGGAKSIIESFIHTINFNPLFKNHKWQFLMSYKPNMILSDNIQINTRLAIFSNWILRILFEFILFRVVFLFYKPDLVISFQNSLFLTKRLNQFLYLHQPIPFQTLIRFKFNRKEYKYWIYQNLISTIIFSSIKRAKQLIVQSEWLKNHLRLKFRRSNLKVVVLKPLVNSKYYNSEKIINNENNFFYPASDLIYKNHKIIYEANLSLFGRYNYNIYFTSSYKQSDNVILLHNLNVDEMISYYNKSVLIFPSIIESFGLPLLEAKILNRIIFASDSPLSREILQDYNNAYFFNPFSPNELTILMEKYLLGKIIINYNPNVSENDALQNQSKVLKAIINE
jgi:glycosyltransferase involved in cell wall biosynthesis